MRRNLAPSQKGSPSLHQRLGVAYPQGCVPPINKNQTNHSNSDPLPASIKDQSVQHRNIFNNGTHNHKVINVGDENSRYFNAVWCKQSARKHKKWEGDALLIVKAAERLAILLDKDNNGKEICRGSSLPISKLSSIENGSVISFGGKEIEIMDEISAQQYQTSISSCRKRSFDAKKADEESKLKELAEASGLEKQRQFSDDGSSIQIEKQAYTSPKFKPFLAPGRISSEIEQSDSLSTSNTPNNVGPRYDPMHPDAIVMPRPRQLHYNSSQSQPSQISEFDDARIVDVVLDPHLGRQLRPHQVEGVLFLYKCVMGYQVDGSFGAILADEMGLGKTLQTIALIWTLLKQSPLGYGKSAIRNALILAPSSLVKNWEAEFTKWLGIERINVCGIDGSGSLGEYINRPARSRSPVLILSYEMFTRAFTSIDENLTFDLVVCDEGHRLKNAGAKASQCLASMSSTDKRIVLTGTPLQNELKEFYAIVSIVCPGVLGSVSQFTRQFEEPICKSKL